ncbi:MAG: hypothetical protein IT429_03930, partial [Gemmataceae bacterium]|nr:hypothetical protein [Gemmataceae bacterium]
TGIAANLGAAANLSATATVSADQRYLRLHLAPVFRGGSGALARGNFNTPVIPGGTTP